jgi:hypothetical protein
MILYNFRDGDPKNKQFWNGCTDTFKQFIRVRDETLNEKADARVAFIKKREREIQKINLPPNLKKLILRDIKDNLPSEDADGREKIHVPFFDVDRPSNYVSYMDIELVFAVHTHFYLWKKAELLEWNEKKLKESASGNQIPDPVPAVAIVFRREPFVWRLRAYLPPPTQGLDIPGSSPVWSTSLADTSSNVPEINFALIKI